jgi:taurine dioxygenase
MGFPNTTQYRHIETRRIAGALGAEVHGVDLSTDLDDAVLAEIRAALLENQVIFFRNQDLTPDRQLAFARRWGEIHFHPFMEGMKAHPEILEIVKRPEEKRNFGGTWHTDQMFSPQPAMGTMLYAKEVPPAGGDTMFTNQYLAYETLSDAMKHMLAGLRTICVGDHFKGHGGRSRKEVMAGQSTMQVKDPGNVQTTSLHPLVRTHPETGRKLLYVGSHVHGLEGMKDEESEPIVDYLMRHSSRPEFTCRFRWETGSMAFWDNRCVQHFAVNDYQGETRVMHRITICGDTPY